MKNYNGEVIRYKTSGKVDDIDRFVNNDPGFIKWTDRLKEALVAGITLEYDKELLRKSLYRPFAKQYIYFDHLLNQRRYRQPLVFPNKQAESENLVICVNQTFERPFCSLMTNSIPNLVMCGGFGAATQSFPFYVYSEEGTSRRDNITDWSLREFRAHYKNNKISKGDIFHYIYAILHHPAYRTKYAANLRRSLPRIPYAPDFGGFAKAGKKLADLHVNYETQPEYKLEFIENPKAKLNWLVEKMKLSKDKTTLVYNEFLTLKGIPKEVFDYRLGNRSALDWIIDQYQISTDKRSGIVNDPNNPDDLQYIVKLIGKVIMVSVETVRIVNGLPVLE